MQEAVGYRMTIKAGTVTFEDGESTGALPGRAASAAPARAARLTAPIPAPDGRRRRAADCPHDDRNSVGSIGPSWRESTPWWPPEPERARGRAERRADRARRRRLRAARLLRLRHRHTRTSTGSPPAACGFANFHTTALCSPTRSCLLTGRNHHSNGMARVADLAVGFPGYCGRIPRRNGFLSEIARRERLRAGRGRQVAPDARGRDAHGRAARELAGRARLPALVRVPRRRDPPVRARTCSRTTTRCVAARSPEQGYHLSEDLADRAIQYLGELRSVEPDQPFFLYFATGACHSPHHAPAEWIERYRGPVRRAAGTRGATRRSPASWSWACSPRARSSRPARTWVPAWDDLEPEDQAVAAALHGVLRRVPLARRRADRAGARVHRRARRARQHARRARLRQRRERRGRRARLDQRRAALERHARRAAGSCASASTSSARRPRTTTTRGAGRWRATRRSGAGSARCTRAASPIRASSTGRAASPARGEIRHQFAHAIDVAADDPRAHRRRRRRPSSRASRRARSKARASCRAAARGRRARDAHHAVLRDARQPRHLPRRLEGGDVQAARRRCTTTASIPTRRSRTTCGSCTTSPRTSPSATTSPQQEPGASSRRWSTSGGRRRASTTCSRSTTGRSPRCSRPGASSATATRYVFYPYGAPIPENVTVNVRNRDHTITADVEVPEGGDRRRRAARDGHACSAAGRSTCSTAGCATCTTALGKERYAVDVATSSCRRAPTSCGSRSRAAATSAATGRLLVDGTVVGEGDDPDDDAGPLLDHRRRPHVRLGAGAAGRRRLRRAVPVHRHARTGGRRGRRRPGTATRRRSSRRSWRSSSRAAAHWCSDPGGRDEHGHRFGPAPRRVPRALGGARRPGDRDDAIRFVDDDGRQHVGRRGATSGSGSPRCRRRARPTSLGERHEPGPAGRARRAPLRRRCSRATTGTPRRGATGSTELGLDEAVLFPNYGLLWERKLSGSLPAMLANMRAWNRWCATVVAEGRGRLHPVAHLSLRDLDWLDAELRPARGRRRAARDDRARPSSTGSRCRTPTSTACGPRSSSTASRRCSTSPTRPGRSTTPGTPTPTTRSSRCSSRCSSTPRPRSRAPTSSSTACSSATPTCGSASSSCPRSGCRCT